MSYIDQLIESCQAAKAALPIKEIHISENSDLSELNGIKTAIYVIEEIDGYPDKTFSDFDFYRRNSDRKCARVNQPNRVMYVGSSTTGVKNRIEQHIGNGHKGTYALHLKYWFKGGYRITVKQYDVPITVLQIVEDDLADRLKPAFGKRGGNSK